jgi:menaquinone-dependent protoporphyrinogen oxidase
MVQPVTRLTGLDDVQAIVLGSAIRYGAWLPEMTRFIESQGTTLRSLPLAIFTVHMQALDDSAASREARSRYTQPLHQLLRPRVEAFFAGRIDPARLSFFERLAVKMVKSPVGDRRDWDRIRDWADSLAVQLH